MRPQSGDRSKLHPDQEQLRSLGKYVPPVPLPALDYIASFSLVLLCNTLPQKATWKYTTTMPPDGQQWVPASSHPLAANSSIKCSDTDHHSEPELERAWEEHLSPPFLKRGNSSSSCKVIPTSPRVRVALVQDCVKNLWQRNALSLPTAHVNP